MTTWQVFHSSDRSLDTDDGIDGTSDVLNTSLADVRDMALVDPVLRAVEFTAPVFDFDMSHQQDLPHK